MKVMDKRIIISLPLVLYKGAKKAAQRHYLSISGLIRQSLQEKLEEEFSDEEMAVIQKSQRSFKAGKGVDWRKVRRVAI